MDDFMADDFNVSSAPQELGEYEKILLAITLNSPKACFEILSKLEAIDFSKDAHQFIFNAIQELSNDGSDISVATVIEKLRSNKKLKPAGGVAYLNDILSYFYTDEGFEEIVAIVFKYSLSRRLDRALSEIKIAKNSNTDSIYELVIEAQEKILNIKTDISEDDAEEVKSIVDRVIKHTFDLMDQKAILTGVPSSFDGVDDLTNGWQKGDFIVLAARPSMGKTALALNLATNAAEKGKHVAFFSLEMPKEQLVQRVLSSIARVDSKKIRTGQGINSDEKIELTLKADIIKEYPIVIDDTPGINILQLQSKIRKLQRDYGIDICFIDYLQLLTGLPNRNENRQNEVSTISRHIKKIARELNIPIICLAQLSRSVEAREEKKPLMSDLRDSGAIEQDADIVMFLYREEYYKRETDNSGTAELIFAKHRNGATGSVNLSFEKDFGKFNDWKN